ncbi:aldo-keto reductase, putative [Paecilomyces variotii No. 5]|uniref:D-xylose reductase [NAD(P)H] n=1 Tax=Byssochlamys spectabilis (strain No. 5 / NBRC 109023) TaxID=1356009 RepID=V5I504_BYSSN|nr:aldo-keto reductase, putative [Paecilomyces variotii No. 5]
MASSLSIQTKYKLNSGHEIPILGYGVYQTPADITEEVTKKAFKIGYRHVDSAQAYRNEKPCGQAIKNSGLHRSEVFFTTKISVQNMGYEKAKASIDTSLKQADVDYFDLILIHSPYGGKQARNGTWRALVEAQKEGKTRSIGVSNYGVHHLDELEEYINSGVGGKIDVGQYELHPWLPRPDIVNWLKKRNVVVEAYSPLTRAQRLDEPVLLELGKKYNKTPGQILLCWSLQKDFVPLPKSITPSRIEENANIFDFQLTEDDMKALHTNDYSPTTWDPTVDRS